MRFRRGGRFLPGETTIKLHPDRLRLPLSWKTPRRIFVNSMSDLFHEEIPTTFIQKVFCVMEEAEQHTFQVLTKRHERLKELSNQLDRPPNVWMGVSVENQHWADLRIPALIEVPATVRFLSIEPLLKAVSVGPYLDELDWAIVGGESGPKARPIQIDWVHNIRDDCYAVGVPFFFKQWGGRTSQADGKALDGRTWDEMPSLNLKS